MTLAKDNANFLKTTKKMLQEEGLHSLFKGLEASLILVINPIIQFLIYEALKEKFSNFPY